MSITLTYLRCASCRAEFLACPDCVNTVRIDPATGYPPDVVVVDGRARHTDTPDAAAVARAVARPVCDGCIDARNAVWLRGGPDAAHMTGPVPTWRARHEVTHDDRAEFRRLWAAGS